MKRVPQDFPNMSGCLEGWRANALPLSQSRFLRGGQNRVRDGAELSRSVRECSEVFKIVRVLSGSVHGMSRNVRPRSGRCPALSLKFLRGPRRRYPPGQCRAAPINTPMPARLIPQKTGGLKKSNPPPLKTSLQYPPATRKNIARPDTNLTGPAVKPMEERSKERSEDTATGKDKALRLRLTGRCILVPNNQYADIFQTRARRCATLSSSSVVAISYSAISPASPSGA